MPTEYKVHRTVHRTVHGTVHRAIWTLTMPFSTVLLIVIIWVLYGYSLRASSLCVASESGLLVPAYSNETVNNTLKARLSMAEPRRAGTRKFPQILRQASGVVAHVLGQPQVSTSRYGHCTLLYIHRTYITSINTLNSNQVMIDAF